jgi:Plastocyanin
MFRTTILLVGMLALTGGIAPVSATSTAKQPATAQARRVHVIAIDKMQYGPMPTDVRAGDVIEWTNHDILEHSATARDGHFDVDLKPGTSGRITVVAGTLVFFCKFHPGMTGAVVVK